MKTDARQHLDGDGDTTQFRGEQQHVSPELGAERNDLEVKPEAFADSCGQRPLAYGRHAAGHLRESRNKQRGRGDCPQQGEPELRSRLDGCRDRADLRESADARDDAEGDFEDLFEVHDADPPPAEALR